MDRRSYLRSVALGSIATTAGCLRSALGNGPENPTVLDPPEDRRYTSEELPYPAHGQELPSFALPDPLAGEVVDTTDIEDTMLVTGFFAFCPVECVQLIGQLAGVQEGTIQKGIDDDVTFLAITFDPQRDDAEALRDYGERMVNLDAGNWRFLRPESPERAKEVVGEELGITFERVGADKSSRIEGYDFRHLSLTFLCNPSGVVERAYRTERPDHERVLDDVETVVEAT